MRVISLFLCTFGLALVALSATAGVSRTAPAASSAAVDGPFSHTKHVSVQWLLRSVEEQPRDCRGCHDYSSEALADREAPAASCARCHGAQQIVVSGTPRVDPARESLFDHTAHGSYDCRTCHAATGGGVPAQMPVPDVRSPAHCATCHAPGGEAADARAALNARIDRFKGTARPGEASAFSHALHLGQKEFIDAGKDACEQCHSSLHEADSRNLGEKQFSVDSCKSCHRHKDDEFETALYERPSKAAATFVHYYHLGTKAAQVNDDIREKRCFACHAQDERTGAMSLNERFAGDAHDGCVSCHNHAGRAVDNHGETDDCRSCHDVSEGTIGGRPLVEVARPMPASFRIESQRHQFITGDVDPDCSKCHLADREVLPSRVSGRSFNHQTHLSLDSKRWRGECHKCHQRMSGAVRPADINGRDLFEWSHCADCHATDEVLPVFDETRPRRVPDFSHDLHLRKSIDGRALDCLDCHVSDPGDLAAGIGLKDSASACTQCHGHNEHPEHTPYSAQTVQSCAECHRVGVPSKGEGILVKRQRLVSMKGDRKHPESGNCFECHAAQKVWAPARDGDLAIKKTRKNPHTQRPIAGHLGTYFEKFLLDDPNLGAERGKWCIDCHWGNPKVMDAQAGARDRQQWHKAHPGEPRWRPIYGTWLEDFPGIDLDAHR